MKRASVPFLDVLFCMLLVFFVLINPDEAAELPPPAEYVIHMDWGEGAADIDMYVEEPGGHIVWFGAKNSTNANLDRDDLGTRGDDSTYNLEVYKLRKAVPGCYYVSVHSYRIGDGAMVGQPLVLTLFNKEGDKIKVHRMRIQPQKVETPVWRICIDKGGASVMPSSRMVRDRAKARSPRSAFGAGE